MRRHRSADVDLEQLAATPRSALRPRPNLAAPRNKKVNVGRGQANRLVLHNLSEGSIVGDNRRAAENAAEELVDDPILPHPFLLVEPGVGVRRRLNVMPQPAKLSPQAFGDHLIRNQSPVLAPGAGTRPCRRDPVRPNSSCLFEVNCDEPVVNRDGWSALHCSRRCLRPSSAALDADGRVRQRAGGRVHCPLQRSVIPRCAIPKGMQSDHELTRRTHLRLAAASTGGFLWAIPRAGFARPSLSETRGSAQRKAIAPRRQA